MPNCPCLETFYASASADAFVYANNGQKVTASATATASSTLNYDDAYKVARSNAKSIAKSTAQNDANIINQSFPGLIVLENLKSSNNVYNIHDNSNYNYIKGSSGNSNSMPPTFFSLGTFTILASAVDSKGNLYVGGSLTASAQSSPVITNVNGLTTENDLFTTYNYIAMWDGSTWSPLGSGLGATVNAIAIDSNDNVYVGGSFTTLGDNSTSANRVAKWNGSTWSPLGNGLEATVNAIAIDLNDNVYAGGSFITLGNNSTSANRVAKWNGSTWSPLGNGLGATVNAIAIDLNDNVYAGGNFTTTGNRIAKWNGSTWSSLGSGLEGTVNAIAIDSNDNVYVGGSFTTLGDMTSANRIAKWTPSAVWSVLGTSAANGVNNTVNALAIDSNDNVYMSGSFTILYGTSTVANYVAKWTPSTSKLSTVGGKIIFNANIFLNGIPSTSSTIAINKNNDTIYAGDSNRVYQLFSDYVNLQYNGILLRQLYLNGQITSVYTNNKNGKKMCSVVTPTPIYQNYF